MKPKLPTVKMVEIYLKTLDTNKIYTNRGPLVRQLELRFADLLKVKEVTCEDNNLAGDKTSPRDKFPGLYI